MLDIPGKTKNNAKAHLDQALMFNRKQLNLVEKPNDEWERPRTPFCLTRGQKRDVLQWVMDIKFPDGYATNWRRGVNLDQLKVHGPKSQLRPIKGVRRLERFGLVEVAHASCNPANEQFVHASQAKQVYYLPYSCKSDPSLNKLWVAHKVSPLGNLSIQSMDDYQAEGPPAVEAFQEDGLDGEFHVDIGLGLDDITSTNNLDEVADPHEVCMLIKHRNGVIEENEQLVQEE
jgi:hypothetical protein